MVIDVHLYIIKEVVTEFSEEIPKVGDFWKF
jgi:hypothetical protein